MAGRPITVAETPLFVRQANDVWNVTERDEFVDFIARNPEAGPLYMLMVYAKAEREDMTPDEKKAVRKLTVVLKTAAQNRRSQGGRR